MTFWSGELLEKELPKLIRPFNKKNIDCASYRLSAGKQAFVTTAAIESEKPEVDLIKNLGTDSTTSAIRISPGQFAFLLTEENVIVPHDALAMISIRAGYKFKGLINVSGFHVDPGWDGKLIFSVYNAGTKPIIIRRGEPLFLIVYAHLDQPSQRIYEGTAKYQKEISISMVENLTSTVFNPQSLKNRLDEVNKQLSTFESFRKFSFGVLTVIALLVSSLAFLPGLTGSIIANALNSAGYKLVTSNSTSAPGQLPLINSTTDQPQALVEAPKTAISATMPQKTNTSTDLDLVDPPTKNAPKNTRADTSYAK
ncbi:dCTP deaminase domain-containing protein [Pseudomonas mosselii]|uniref:dCTP deaminase domain-containing protein n=1 Tax=Pseudomonas mosselii TaxID=78327 RepID=UPI000AB3A86D|nr:deoxycytidine triphosphate deaminase [Pseudomonas mosselii]